MVQESAAEIEKRLDAGEWLKAGQVAALLGVGVATVHRWFNQGKLAYRKVGGDDGQRVADPVTVRARLAASREVHGQ